MALSLAELDDVRIDPGGVFKYVLIRVWSESDNPQEKTIVRGWASAEYHADIYEQVSSWIQKQGLQCECQGGGRINHNSAKKTIHVYGYSMGYGRAKHEITTELLKAKYPDYNVTWANEGY
ncbi:14 kDa phosphohistidine phosphatase-like isoform X2 [Rhincodon typus]|uniref:14 kDa phosphohistidine phosphatase-like isoform X2 n=1 Tax=Rhincodon typus TaxID=259920 RepID=UPI00202FE79C|nr:14 kDa phosphohistidine phosphatase-like isoform X2 [Rhincodon typus]XP_048448271.1 14 kDa phosphohistidine phosphatase-like isoform X2 [Rhincodon typus]